MANANNPSLWPATPPPPPTKLGIYRRLCTTAGVHVSPLVFGGMSVGTADNDWRPLVGDMDREKSFELLDAYYNAGGNFIDVANNYQDETSERLIGEWVEKRGIRDQLFISTKYTANFKRHDKTIAQKVLYVGNNSKSLHLSLQASLEKLRTTYVDLLYIHWWDYDTSTEEVMQSLNKLVQAGKVLYLGISDTPAWVVARANEYARCHALRPFSVYQGAWNIMMRDFERDIIPMARAEGMALAPWHVVGGGKFRTDVEEEQRRVSGEKGRTLRSPNWERTENERKASAALEKVAKEVGTRHITSVAIAYVMHKAPYVFPIIGCRKIEQLYGNIESLDISLTDDQITELESAVEFDIGFPTTLVGNETSAKSLLCTSINFAERLLLQPYRHDK